MENTIISWTDNTFNPWCGCTKISDGCKNCYAEKKAGNKFFKNTFSVWGPSGTRKVLS